MATISLKELIDDILLIVRNNNISESEDFSRAQIASWILAYRNRLWQDKLDELKLKALQTDDLTDLIDDMYLSKVEVGPMELESVETFGTRPIFTKRTKNTLADVFNNSEKSILAIHDVDGCDILYMNHVRRHYHYYRKYTFSELTGYYKDDGHIYILGFQDDGNLNYVWVAYIKENLSDEDETDNIEDPDEDDIKIPTYMVPDIKYFIMNRELSFMLNRPSDDLNDSSLDTIKPNELVQRNYPSSGYRGRRVQDVF